MSLICHHKAGGKGNQASGTEPSTEPTFKVETSNILLGPFQIGKINNS